MAQNDFGSRILFIVVGAEKVQFNVHYDRLAKTAFFEVHGDPPSQTEKEALLAAARIRSSSNNDSDAIPDDEDVKVDLRPDALHHRGEITDNVIPDFHLKGRFVFDPKAFSLFVHWLYHEEPGPLESRDDCLIALKAYILARKYRAYSLQNKITDRFRQHCAQYSVKFDDLIWLANRTGDSSEATPLTNYFIHQIAYEVTTTGFAEYKRGNSFFETFLTQGNWKIRCTLFEVMALHAKAGGRQDPARGTVKWHVVENGHAAGSWCNTRGLP